MGVLRRESFYLERSAKALGGTNHWSHTLKGCRNFPGAEGGCGKSFGAKLIMSQKGLEHMG